MPFDRTFGIDECLMIDSRYGLSLKFSDMECLVQNEPTYSPWQQRVAVKLLSISSHVCQDKEGTEMARWVRKASLITVRQFRELTVVLTYRPNCNQRISSLRLASPVASWHECLWPLMSGGFSEHCAALKHHLCPLWIESPALVAARERLDADVDHPGLGAVHALLTAATGGAVEGVAIAAAGGFPDEVLSKRGCRTAYREALAEIHLSFLYVHPSLRPSLPPSVRPSVHPSMHTDIQTTIYTHIYIYTH